MMKEPGVAMMKEPGVAMVEHYRLFPYSRKHSAQLDGLRLLLSA
jgi:hypothetical protein